MPSLNHPFADSLISEATSSDIPEEQRLFDPLIGSWDLVVTWYDHAGAISRRETGEWHFARVLDGRGIQDVWIVPGLSERAAGTGPYEYGTSIRFYDPAIAAWRSTWIGPRSGVVIPFIGRRSGDGILLETLTGDPMRWSFHDITDDRFTWENRKEDGDWRLVQDFVAARHR